MVAITPKPLFFVNPTIKIGTDSYEAAISACTLTPSSSVVTFKGLKPTAVFNFATPSTWVAGMTFSQDWTTAGSLSNYLFANEGTKVTMTIVPAADDNKSPTVTVTVFIQPGSIGGDAGAVSTSQVSLPVDGKPTITAAP